jgi:hypothetical protein
MVQWHRVPAQSGVACCRICASDGPVYPGNYGHNDFAGGNDLVSQSNTLRTEGVKTCQVLLGKVFKALTPGRQLVIRGAGAMPAFGTLVSGCNPVSRRVSIACGFARNRNQEQS